MLAKWSVVEKANCWNLMEDVWSLRAKDTPKRWLVNYTSNRQRGSRSNGSLFGRGRSAEELVPELLADIIGGRN